MCSICKLIDERTLFLGRKAIVLGFFGFTIPVGESQTPLLRSRVRDLRQLNTPLFQVSELESLILSI